MTSASKPLTGQTALVTGASYGMGKATARLLAEDGATVMIAGRRQAVLDEALAELREQVPGARFEAFKGDAGDAAQAQAAIDAAHAIAGRLDIIVSAVGRGMYKPILDSDETDVLEEFRLSFLSAFFMIRYGAPRMENGGSIVCVSSITTTIPSAGLSAYAASKAALEMFIKVASVEMGKAQVRINGVRPGFTRAEGTEFMFDDPKLMELVVDRIPLGRAGESVDLARAIRFLAGPESGWLTGQIFSADGGQEHTGLRMGALFAEAAAR